MTTEAQDQETKALYRAMVLRRVGICSLVLALALTLGVILYAVVAIRNAQVTNTGTLNASNRTLHLFLDCTTPQGKCFRQSQARTGQLVGGLNEGSRDAAAAAADCAIRPDVHGYLEIKACIDKTLETKTRKAKP